MKTISIKNKDLYDLASVIATVVREKSDVLDFKEVINLQKMVNYFVESLKTYSDQFESIIKERDSLVTISNKKISDYRAKLIEKGNKNPESIEDSTIKVDNFLNVVKEETETLIRETINPKFETLSKGLGEEKISIELEEEKATLLVINFEKYAKEKYTNKSKLVEVYELLTA